jgi:hypothetical protein
MNTSDFEENKSSELLKSSSFIKNIALVGIGTSTVGFLEACASVKQRPIPLQFALRYAFYNLLPSTVWKGIPALEIAVLSGIPISNLLPDLSQVVNSAPYTKTRVLMRSLMALRHLVASYGLLWSLWDLQRSEEKYEEHNMLGNAIRIAAPGSELSEALIKRHGSHFMITDVQNPNLFQKFKLSLQSIISSRNERPKLSLIEVDFGEKNEGIISIEKSLAQIQASRPIDSCFVGILPAENESSTSASFGFYVDPSQVMVADLAQYLMDIDAKNVKLDTDGCLNITPFLLYHGFSFRYIDGSSEADLSTDDAVVIIRNTYQEALDVAKALSSKSMSYLVLCKF